MVTLPSQKLSWDYHQGQSTIEIMFCYLSYNSARHRKKLKLPYLCFQGYPTFVSTGTLPLLLRLPYLCFQGYPTFASMVTLPLLQLTYL